MIIVAYHLLWFSVIFVFDIGTSLQEKEQKRLQEEAEKEEKRREIEMKKQLKKQQEEAEKEEKEQRRREKEEAEQKKQLALQKQASVLERFLKKSKSSSPAQVNQPTVKACVADILPKQGVQVPESVTHSMDHALSQKDEFDVNDLRKYAPFFYYTFSLSS